MHILWFNENVNNWDHQISFNLILSFRIKKDIICNSWSWSYNTTVHPHYSSTIWNPPYWNFNYQLSFLNCLPRIVTTYWAELVSQTMNYLTATFILNWFFKYWSKSCSSIFILYDLPLFLGIKPLVIRKNGIYFDNLMTF